MKNITFLVLCLITIFSFSQSKIDTLKNKKQLTTIEKDFKKDSTINKLEDKIELEKNKNVMLSTALEVNNNIFGGLSTYFTIISILLSIIVIAIPVVNYFLVLKPNKEVLSKLEKLEIEIPQKIETDFGVYMSEFEKRKAKQLIKTLDDNPNLSDIVNFFFLSSFSDFDDEDQTTVIKFLKKKNDIDDTHRLILNSILKSKPSIIAESFYKNMLEIEDKDQYKSAIEYLTDEEPEKNIKFFELLIKGSDKSHEILMDIFDHIYNHYLGTPFGSTTNQKKKTGEEKAILFLNNEIICNAVKDYEYPKHISEKININVANWNPFIKETLYYKNRIEKKNSH